LKQGGKERFEKWKSFKKYCHLLKAAKDVENRNK